jgi:site-specific DNA-methyltransferase (adenine-specific)
VEQQRLPLDCIENISPLPCSEGDSAMREVFHTDIGRVYQADCLDFLGSLKAGSVHTLFADPPFNLNKKYGRKGRDDRSEVDYIEWSCRWLAECVRVLAPGGALFVYNLPKWLIQYGFFLQQQPELTFKHWIAIDKAHSLPIADRLSPSHYGMLYFIKGSKPRVFNRDDVRTSIRKCRHCDGDVKDYGGHRKYLNSKGINLKDVWDDVPPVRHSKYKNRPANELAPVILERVIKLTSNERDLICDPFAGGGVTAYVAERLNRRWLVADINDCTAIQERLTSFRNGSHPVWKEPEPRTQSIATASEQSPI